MGGRSRNGWGSVRMESEPAAANADFSQYFRPWQDALDEQWPHALGKDGAPLVWGTKPQADWKGAMERLKEVRKGIYGQMKNAHERALVSYPVTRSKRPLGWDKSYRLPNSLRFKVRPRRDGRVCGVVFHVPCKPTKAIAAETAKLRAIWRRVHGHLDGRSDLQRSRW